MSIEQLLADLNPWWHGSFASTFRGRRHVFHGLLDGLMRQDRRAVVVVGPRQVGKSVLLEHLIEGLLQQGVPPKSIVFFDFSDERAVTVRAQPDDILRMELPGVERDAPRFYFFDEVTSGFPEGKSWALWLKRVVDRRGRRDRFVVTDSAAPMLRDGRESGLGRWDDVRLEPLTFAEFLDLNAVGAEGRGGALKRMPNALALYLELGGFPEHAVRADPTRVRLARERLRSDIADKAIYRDLARRGLDVARVHALFVYLLEDSGAIFDPKMRTRLLTQLGGSKPVDHRSVAEWLGALEDSMLVCPLELFGRSASGRLAGRAYPKVYAADAGLVNAFASAHVAHDDPYVVGRAIEAAVFRHLRGLGAKVSYARDKPGDHEVDFVLSTPGKTVGVEVKSGEASSAHVMRLAAASKYWKLDRAVLVHRGVTARREGVELLSLVNFLLTPERVL